MSENADKTIQQLVKEWLELDQNEATRQEIKDLSDKKDYDELEKRLRTRIAFGTAGLRSSMQAGFAHLNPLTIIQASQGLASYLLASIPQTVPPSPKLSVIIGHDHRHNSSQFAKLTATAFILKGIKVYFLEDLVHTPLVPFGLNLLGANAGVMITASHNPAKDNGYKVYWGNGCQIIPPVDAGIAAAISENLIPLEGAWDTSVLDKAVGLVENVKGRVEEAYFEKVKGLVDGMAVEGAGKVGFVYTPMHGVGLEAAKQVVKILGVEDDFVVVEEQAKPDPDFPTVKFPNPEEKGALDLAMATADKHGITIVLANDPDADRFAAAEKVNGKWQILTGNQLGVLFASHMVSTSSLPASKVALLSSAVSTQMLAAMGQIDGFHHEETLTGFKWLGNVAQQITSRGTHKAIYAFEEAIGYMFSDVVHDKDGIAALSVFITMLKKWLSEGITPAGKLQELYETYGFFESCNGYVVSPSPDVTRQVFDGIRRLGDDSGKKFPGSLGGREINYWRDLTEGYDSATISGIPVLPVDRSSQMITVGMEGVRFTIRGSGTEPKIKYYVEAKASGKEEASAAAKEVADAIVREWFKPEVHGLVVS
ncbi:Phosphoglucomutase-3 [Orbilia oligospora]|uniref:Phosphoglucomutase-3 n=1 Tax=Orbilia oligospora TaxID=2813651 RepID=A0A6G1M7L3_ORBOL|nr:Phosphoglucomutase-3 [Orbilia oligospora]KAF3230146.1 Phosphoglucomutase-3 [Orbilia oligospora]KAF3247635.1 Phosphoglucomutase-3 [Orbilia oligospora]